MWGATKGRRTGNMDPTAPVQATPKGGRVHLLSIDVTYQTHTRINLNYYLKIKIKIMLTLLYYLLLMWF